MSTEPTRTPAEQKQRRESAHAEILAAVANLTDSDDGLRGAEAIHRFLLRADGVSLDQDQKEAMIVLVGAFFAGWRGTVLDTLASISEA